MQARPSTLPAQLYADLLPVPYLAGGRTMAGMDCVGLFLELQARLGMQIPRYASDVSVIDVALASWEKLDRPELGAGVLIRSIDPRWHLGVMVSEDRFIHAKEGCGVAIDRLDSIFYRNRIEGIYRWQACAR